MGRYHGGSLCASSKYLQTLGEHPLTSASTGLFRAKVVLTHYRGFQMPHGERFDGWLERLFEHPSFKATCSTEQLYLDSYERSVHGSFPTALNLKYFCTNHIGMPLIDPTRAWWRLRLTRGERCRSHLILSTSTYEMRSKNKMLSIVFWRDNGVTRESGFDLKDSLASNLQLCTASRRWRPQRQEIWLLTISGRRPHSSLTTNNNEKPGIYGHRFKFHTISKLLFVSLVFPRRKVLPVSRATYFQPTLF